MARVAAIFLTALVALTGLPNDASAVKVLRTDFAGLVDGAAMIVEGRVLSVDMHAGRLEPRTRVTLRIERHFDGEHPGSHLTFDLPMGVMPDGSVLDIAEAPRFAPGASYLVFYKRGDWRITPVVGWDQGYFRAVAVDGEDYFVDAGGHCVTGLDGMGFAIGAKVAPAASMPGFGDPVAAGPDDRIPSTAPCMAASTVRSHLQSRLAAAPTPPAGDWRPAPASEILRTPLMLDASRLERAGCGRWASCPDEGDRP